MNVLLIMCDALRAGLGKRSGSRFDVCPALDRMAAEGTSFGRAYCTMPLCMPSRISMLTGRWPDGHRVRMNLDAKDAIFTKDVYQVAHEQGYRTGLAGKNHTYLNSGSVDFWREYGHEGGHRSAGSSPAVEAFERWLKTLDMGVAEEETPFPLEVQLPYRIVSDAIDFLKTSGDMPFFLQVSFPEPHGPSQVPRPYWDMFPPEEMVEPVPGPEAVRSMGYRMQWLARLQKDGTPAGEGGWRRYLSNYYGAVRMVDDQIARLMEYLRSSGLEENTVIVFTADHGDYGMEYGLGRKGVGLPEPLTHIPMIWRGGKIRRSRKDEIHFVSMADVMPTLCETMEARIPDGVQGRSLWSLLRGDAVPSDRFRSIYSSAGVGGLYYDASDDVPVSIAEGKADRHLWDTLNKVTQSGNQKMVRMGKWKLIFDMMGYGQMYNLSADPHEQHNVFGQPDLAGIQDRLMRELALWAMRTEDTLPAKISHKAGQPG